MSVRSHSVVQNAAAAGMFSAVSVLAAADAMMTAVGSLLAPPSWDAAGVKAWADGAGNIHRFSAAVQRGLIESGRVAQTGASFGRAIDDIDTVAAIGVLAA